MISTQAVADTIEQLHAGMARLGDRPPPEPVDRDFERLARRYWTADDETRAAIRAAVADKDRMLILNLGYRATQLALWDRDALHLQDAMAGHCIEGFLWDPRDNLVRLAPIWYVAKELGISAGDLFSSAAERTTAEAANYIREFAASPSSLRSMGLEIAEENGRAVIQPLPPAWRRPKPARKPKGHK